MLLSDTDMYQMMQMGLLHIDPFESELMQPCSIDVRLDRHLLTWPPVHPGWFEVNSTVDPAREHPMVPVEIPDGHAYEIQPGQMLLASTIEQVTLGGLLAARVEGKSSIGRLGLAVHVTAGFIDPGFSGHITLELVNHNPRPVLLHPGMRIGQLCVFELKSSPTHLYGSAAYGSRYQGQRGPTASRSWQNWRTWPARQDAA